MISFKTFWLMFFSCLFAMLFTLSSHAKNDYYTLRYSCSGAENLMNKEVPRPPFGTFKNHYTFTSNLLFYGTFEDREKKSFGDLEYDTGSGQHRKQISLFSRLARVTDGKFERIEENIHCSGSNLITDQIFGANEGNVHVAHLFDDAVARENTLLKKVVFELFGVAGDIFGADVRKIIDILEPHKDVIFDGTAYAINEVFSPGNNIPARNLKTESVINDLENFTIDNLTGLKIDFEKKSFKSLFELDETGFSDRGSVMANAETFMGLKIKEPLDNLLGTFGENAFNLEANSNFSTPASLKKLTLNCERLVERISDFTPLSISDRNILALEYLRSNGLANAMLRKTCLGTANFDRITNQNFLRSFKAELEVDEVALGIPETPSSTDLQDPGNSTSQINSLIRMLKNASIASSAFSITGEESNADTISIEKIRVQDNTGNYYGSTETQDVRLFDFLKVMVGAQIPSIEMLGCYTNFRTVIDAGAQQPPWHLVMVGTLAERPEKSDETFILTVKLGQKGNGNSNIKIEALSFYKTDKDVFESILKAHNTGGRSLGTTVCAGSSYRLGRLYLRLFQNQGDDLNS